MMAFPDIDEVLPGDASYEEVKDGWNLQYKQTPTKILLPRTEEAAAECLRDVISREEKFRIRSGGHDVNGYSSADDAIVIDLVNLNKVILSEDQKTVKVGPATRFQKLYPALGEHKLCVPAGICSDVAVGGHALGGGNGYLHRFLGVSCDQVIDMKLVDVNGKVIHANAEENPDLFWALRGAGNANFGMVLEYTYITTRVESFSTYAITWKWDIFDEVFQLWQDWAPFADTRLTSTFTLYKDEITAMGMFAGPERELLSLMPDFIKNSADQVAFGTDEYERYDTALDGLMSHYVQGDNSVSHEHATFAACAVFCKSLDKPTQAEFKQAIRNSPGTCSIVFFARGGRICGVPTDHNAYRYRTQNLEPMFRTTWNGDEQRDACLKWITDCYSQMQHHFEGVYKNWTYSKCDAGMYQWYGDGISRLITTKRKWDPENIFNNPQSLPVYITEKHIKEWAIPDYIVEELRQQGNLA